jgi:hypothetical protein
MEQTANRELSRCFIGWADTPVMTLRFYQQRTLLESVILRRWARQGIAGR